MMVINKLKIADSDIRYMNYARWRIELKRRDVFVIIDKIMLELLRHGIMRIEEISLLIFDECHHTGGQSDYSLIMREYYFQYYDFYHFSNYDPIKSKRPKIFWLTASPIKSTHGKKIDEREIKGSLEFL